MAAPLHFYFDFISPYGYFASLRIEELAARHGRTVEWHAMLLGVSVLKVMGLKPLLDTPLKGDYARRDVGRYIRKHGLELLRDADAPVMNPLPAARAFHWVKHHHPALAAPFAHLLYDAYWVQGKDLGTAAAITALPRPAGTDREALLAAIDGPEAATLLRNAVDASLKAGIFGSPTIVVDGEPFWGTDRLAEVDEWLSRGGW
jgi:2-hydroxychromene-2-carboxylate isomerase